MVFQCSLLPKAVLEEVAEASEKLRAEGKIEEANRLEQVAEKLQVELGRAFSVAKMGP